MSTVPGAVLPAAGRGARPAPEPLTFPPSRVARAVVSFLVLFLLVFPKGGVKVAGVPVTWGYAGLAAASVLLPVALISRRPLAFHRSRLLVLGILAPFQALSLASILAHGWEETGFTISFVVSLFFVPTMFVLVLGMYLDRMDLAFVLRMVRWGVLLVAAYGIFLFFYKFATGKFVEVPYLTVNADDAGLLETKNIDRGGIFKLISTYNNGNLYGTSLLILLPLYCWLEPRRLARGIVKVSLLLALSRSVWLGLLMHEVMQRVYVRRVSARSLVGMAAALVVLVGGVLYCVHLLGRDPASFLFDRNLGGRQVPWQHPDDLALLPRVPFATILEMVYLSMLYDFGVVGLVLFIVGMAAPIAMQAMGDVPFAGTRYKRSLALGLMVYMALCLSDGGLLFIPVMAFYWFVASLLLSGNPSFAASAGEADQRRLSPGPAAMAVA